ncbi:unnamed protein product [Anisakis simplex]|uniref:Ovate family protein n=1 Tax=Anisakis simplex TaxID=6269 RepID=A0A0M3KI70_ANISI|nr:unnamed protein product [Anisakis simplex]
MSFSTSDSESVSNPSPNTSASQATNGDVSLFSLLAWDICKRPFREDDLNSGSKRKQKTNSELISEVRMKAMEESVKFMSDMPQVYMLCNVSNKTELENIWKLANLDQPGWICSNSIAVK